MIYNSIDFKAPIICLYIYIRSLSFTVLFNQRILKTMRPSMMILIRGVRNNDRKTTTAYSGHEVLHSTCRFFTHHLWARFPSGFRTGKASLWWILPCDYGSIQVTDVPDPQLRHQNSPYPISFYTSWLIGFPPMAYQNPPKKWVA